MIGYNAQDLARSFRTVRENTIKIAEEIPDNQYGFRPADKVRTVGETLAHLAVAPRFMHRFHAERLKAFDIAGFPAIFERIRKEEAELNSKPRILESLRTGGEEFAKWLATLSDDVLAEQVQNPAGDPPTKTRFEMLLSIKEHEMHHRGQLMMIERMLGITPHLTRQMQERFAAARQVRA